MQHAMLSGHLGVLDSRKVMKPALHLLSEKLLGTVWRGLGQINAGASSDGPDAVIPGGPSGAAQLSRNCNAEKNRDFLHSAQFCSSQRISVLVAHRTVGLLYIAFAWVGIRSDNAKPRAYA